MFALSDIEKPISPESPCGPDPELDPEVQNFLSVAEGQLPSSYRDFNKKAFESKPVLAQIGKYVTVSHDVRYFVLAAKYAILADDLAGFSQSISALRALIAAKWESFHPTEASGGNVLRSAYLQSLDDKPTIVFPLQSMPLIVDKRLGAISMRSILVADKKLPSRPYETVFDLDAIQDAFQRYEGIDHLAGIVGSLTGVTSDLEAIRQVFQEKLGHEQAPMFDQLPAMVEAICKYLNGVLSSRAPAAAPVAERSDALQQSYSGDSAAKAQDAPSDIVSVKEASNALEAILAYYAASEPSSPARLLVKQAHQLVGKSFVEAMRILAPSLAEETKIKFSGDQPFSLDFGQLSSLLDDESGGEENDYAEARSFTAASRSEASTLMRSVEQFYKVKEPSSPIPLLVERARYFVAKDFSSLLKEMAKTDDGN